MRQILKKVEDSLKSALKINKDISSMKRRVHNEGKHRRNYGKLIGKRSSREKLW